MADEERNSNDEATQNIDSDDEVLIEELDERLEFGIGIIDDLDDLESHNDTDNKTCENNKNCCCC